MQTQTDIIYNGDTRYPGPSLYLPPREIEGLPTQEELDGFGRMFSWAEVKEIVYSGDLERLMRNKALQQRYDEWMGGMKKKYGSTENYLKNVRLPWKTPTEPTFDLSTSLDKAFNQDVPKIHLDTNTGSTTPVVITPTTPTEGSTNVSSTPAKSTSHISVRSSTGLSTPASGASTPSAGFVSLASLKMVNGKLRQSKGGKSASTLKRDFDTPLANSSEEGSADDEVEEAVYLKWDDKVGLDERNFAVLPNDWPYNIPYGVRHFCVWSRIPIAHPELVNYDADAWSRVEEQGLGGFTGITPLTPIEFTSAPTSPPSANPSYLISATNSQGRPKFLSKLEKHQWYSADVAYGGGELQKWAGVEYESLGGKEVGNMVRGLWDERGWECLWFVNPPRLQSVPGFSHFHVFARRKTPEEVDAAEVAFAWKKDSSASA